MPPVPLIKASLWDILCGKKGCFLFFTLIFHCSYYLSPICPHASQNSNKKPSPFRGSLGKARPCRCLSSFLLGSNFYAKSHGAVMAGEKRVQRAAPMGVSLIRISTGPFLLTVGNTFLWGYWVGNLGLLGRKKKK